ncbi:MAG: hypothetical protein ACM3X7_02650 [Solirubrobacterales bacterium]
MNDLFDESGHLKKETLNSIKEQKLDSLDLADALDHICLCEICSEMLSDGFQENDLADAPSGFKEETLSKIKKKKDKHKEFIFYSFRVAIAASISLLIVVSSSLNLVRSNLGMFQMKSPDTKIVNSISTKLNDFSQKIVNMEVFYSEKEKK